MMRGRSLLAGLAFIGTACTTLHRQPGTPAEVVSAPAPPDRVTLTLTNGSRMDLWNPKVQGDSIVGFTRPIGDIRRAHRAEAMANISGVAIKKTDAVASIVVIGIVGGALLFAVAAASLSKHPFLQMR